MKVFEKVKINRRPKNKFDLSHDRKFSMSIGQLIPVMVQEILPGDSFRVNTEMLLRFAPMLAPVMHEIQAKFEWFFVPNRLVWSEWEDFITGGRDGTSVPVAPYFNLNQANIANGVFQVGELPDYMGVPTFDTTVTGPAVEKISALPFRAFQLIYDEYYRDQNLTNEGAWTRNSGLIPDLSGELSATLAMRFRSYEKDYFMSALPWAQRGGEAQVPVDVTYSNPATAFKGGAAIAAASPLTTQSAGSQPGIAADGGGIEIHNIEQANVMISLIRKAEALQKWLEANARGGARYIEQLLAHWNEWSSDQRLQRPEYLAGAVSPVRISEVLSTVGLTSPETQGPQGNMSGHALSASAGNGFTRSFEEHGYVIGIMSVVPKTAYMQGIPKHLQRFDKFDYPWPEFATMGEQAILSKELFFDPLQPNTNASTFGYTPRYSECKFHSCTVHGDFRTSLAYWHMAQIYSSPPVLNGTFVTMFPGSYDRIFAVTDPTVDKLYVQVYNNVSALRKLPYFGTPTI